MFMVGRENGCSASAMSRLLRLCSDDLFGAYLGNALN